MSGITQSLAGWTALLELLPFFYQECYADSHSGDCRDLDKIGFTGFYPPIHDQKLTAGRWYANYIQTYIEEMFDK